MDLMTFTWCALAPAAVAALGAFGCQALSGVLPAANDQPVSWSRKVFLVLEARALALSWWFSICIGVASSGALAWWPADAWPRVIWPMLIAVVFLSPYFHPRSHWSITEKAASESPGLWVLVSLLAIIAASLAMPSGEGWSDMLPLHQTWLAAVATATICNTWALHRMSQRNTERWFSLVLIAGLACPALIGAAAYSALAQACLAAIAAMAVITIFAVAGKLPVTSVLILPCSLFTTTMIAAGRFYSYAEKSEVDYGIALFAPSIIAVVDQICVRQSSLVRFIIAATTGSCIVGFIVYRFLFS